MTWVQILFAALGLGVAVGGGIIKWLWAELRAEQKLRREADEALTASLRALAERLHAHEIQVRDRYASVGYLKDVEARVGSTVDKVVGHIEKVEGKLDELSRTLTRLLAELVKERKA